MKTETSDKLKRPGTDRIITGLLLLAAGVLLLAYKMGAPIPGWLFTWPVLLILIGIISCIKSNFSNAGGFIMIVVGLVFFIDHNIEGIDFRTYIFPAILITIGMFFILRPKGGSCSSKRRMMHEQSQIEQYKTNSGFNSDEGTSNFNEQAEYIDVNAIFGGVKKQILSKNFKGGQILSFMGGTDINLMKADMQHPVVLEVHNIFGGTKLVIPANWDIKNEISAVFGGVEDKRLYNNIMPDPNKVILLKGSCVFGGLEISNY